MRHLFFLFFLLIFHPALIAQPIDSLNQAQTVDFKKVEAELSVFPEKEEVTGKVIYSFEILKESDSIYIDAKDMQFSRVILNGAEVATRNDSQRLWINNAFLPSDANKIELEFVAKPKQAMYFINWNISDDIDASRQVWTQGQGKYTSHWLPSFDDMNEKAEFDLTVNFSAGYEVIASGKLLKSSAISDAVVQWEYDMQQPMSSYLVAIAAGEFEKQDIVSASGIPLQLYYEPKDAEKHEPTYRYSGQIFDFLEEEIGVDYPWQNYKQIPVQDFLYAGMENTGTTIFSDSFLTDSIGFNDRNYVNVNAHELAHQWFGNLVTATEGKHHWLQEGFATYYALLAEREIFGDDYYYWKLYETAERLKELSDSGKGEALLNPKASSLTFYQKGAWALHILREKVGDEAFREGIKNYLEFYKFKNVTTDNFIAEIEKSSNEDLSEFMKDWLTQSAFQGSVALNSLEKSNFIAEYIEIAALRETPLPQKFEELNNVLKFPVNDYIGQEAVYQLAGETSSEAFQMYEEAFESNNLYVRQAVASSLAEIPQILKSQYESLLEDKSYLTRETALYKLWSQFPADRDKYLEATANTEGFSDKNIGLLWRTLNLATPNYEPENQQEVYRELSGFTASYHPYQVRQQAFGYLYQINAFSDQNLKYLMEGTQHHTYNFRNFCRQLLEELLQNEEYRKKYEDLGNALPENQKEFLDKKLVD